MGPQWQHLDLPPVGGHSDLSGLKGYVLAPGVPHPPTHTWFVVLSLLGTQGLFPPAPWEQP